MNVGSSTPAVHSIAAVTVSVSGAQAARRSLLTASMDAPGPTSPLPCVTAKGR
jgi:hypothetical protein